MDNVGTFLSSLWSTLSPWLGDIATGGALTAGVVEAGKLVIPSVVAGKEKDRAVQLAIGAVAAKALGVAGFATIGWAPLLVAALFAPFVSAGFHDVAAPYIDKVTKPVSSTVLAPITGIAERLVGPFAAAFKVAGAK